MTSRASGQKLTSPFLIPPSVGGINAVSSPMAMPKTDAVVLENFIAYPDRLALRDGCADWVTGFGAGVDRLWNYASLTGGEKLFATTNGGVFDATSTGVVGAAVAALTNGKTSASILSTGANTYLTIVNGTDTAKQYDGAVWAAIAAFGATATTEYNAIETYRQRYFLIRKNSLYLEYLAANAVAGATTQYNLGSYFRRGGYLVGLATWTIDGGAGPDDHLAICTSMGEIVVFAGADPATWSLRGVYYIARPLGNRCFYKYGGDLLYACEAGVYPLSKALLTASIDRTQSVSQKIQTLYSSAATSGIALDGWQLVAQPDIPLLIANIPTTGQNYQFAMHAQTGAWSTFSGWDANCFARMGNTLYYGTSSKVVKVGGVSDFGTNITGTMLSAWSNVGQLRNKMAKLVRPYFSSDGAFTYTMGMAQNFNILPPATSQISAPLAGSAAIWGTALWGTGLWTAGTQYQNDWRTVPDLYSQWKALYLQVVTNQVSLDYLGTDARFLLGGDF